MSRRFLVLTAVVTLTALAMGGCASRQSEVVFREHKLDLLGIRSGGHIEVKPEPTPAIVPDAAVEPLSLNVPQRTPWLISPAEAVQIAVERSKVLQDLGGSFLRNTAGIATIHEPAIQNTDPRLGVEAALAAFDAQWNSRTFVNKNDFPINNRLLGGGTNLVKQDLITFQNELTKATAVGSELFVRKNSTYDSNNAPSNLFRSSWQTNIEAGFRHHLLRGGGLDYNRIAGPGSAPGTYNGVMIARLNSDTSILDFEMGLRDLISDVENAYWDLYFAYRNLEAKIAARDAALNTWRIESLKREQQSGSGEREARAREQYYRYEAQVIEALTGREQDGTHTNNGSSGGSFRAVEGVHLAERRLRLLLNLPINDDRMLRPSHDPILVKVVYEWDQIVSESLQLRPELRKQDLQVERSRLELLASKNAILPQLDLLTQYRVRGFGHDYWSGSEEPFDNAVASLMTGHFQEWQFGLEMNMPVGFRRAYNNMRNAQLKLARDNDLLEQKQRRVLHDVSNAYSSVIRAYEIASVTHNQRLAAHEQLAILRNLEQNENKVNVTEILDAQNRAAQADIAYYDSLVRYMIALKNVHYEKGTLFEYDNIALVDRVIPSRNRQIMVPRSDLLPVPIQKSDLPQTPPEAVPPTTEAPITSNELQFGQPVFGQSAVGPTTMPVGFEMNRALMDGGQVVPSGLVAPSAVPNDGSYLNWESQGVIPATPNLPWSPNLPGPADPALPNGNAQPWPAVDGVPLNDVPYPPLPSTGMQSSGMLESGRLEPSYAPPYHGSEDMSGWQNIPTAPVESQREGLAPGAIKSAR